MRNPTRNLALALAVAALGLVPAAALADHGADDGGGDDHGGQRDDRGGDDNGGARDDDKRDEKRVAGSCSGGSTAKLKVKHDDGRLETEFEVDQNRNGVGGPSGCAATASSS